MEYRGVTGIRRESNGPYWALVERGEKGQEVAHASPLPKPNWTRGGGATPFPSLLLRIGKGILLGLGSPSRTPYAWHAPSPAPVTSSSPSPRRCVDGTFPRPQLDQEFKGRHRAKRVQITEVSCVRYLIGWIAKTFDYINRVT